MIDHRVGTEFGRRLVVEAEGDGHGGRARSPRCEHVVGRIPDIGRPSAAEARGHLEDQVRSGLGPARAEGVAAQYRGEAMGEAQFLENLAGERFELVGHHRKPNAPGREVAEHGLGPREGARMDRDVGAIEGQQVIIERGEGVCRDHPVAGKRAFQHYPWAAANEVLDPVRREGRAADPGQGVVHRGAEVAERIEEGAVEVEADDPEGEIAHRGADGAMLWKRQAFAGKARAMTESAPLAIVVLAAGKGTRMKSDLHKVLHQIAGRPMIEHLLASAAELAPERQVVVVGSGREQLEAALDGRAGIAVQDPQHGTGHAVQQAEGALAGFSGDVLILYGDVPFVSAATMRAMIERLHQPDEPAVVVLGFEPADPLQYGRVIAQQGLILKMVEHKDATEAERACGLCNSGLMAVRSNDLFGLLARVGNDNAQGEYYLTDIVNIANADARTCAVVVTVDADEVAGINSRAELAEAEQRWQSRRRRRVMDEGASLVAPETVWFAWDTVVGRDVTIEPNVVFGPGVTVADGARIRAFCHVEGASLASGTEVGPYARLRPGAVIEEKAKVGNFVEVKKSVLGKGAKANHLSYIGDAEVGAGANIGAGTITCNYDGYFKYKTVIGERAFIGSNSSLIAPVKIGRDAIVGAGSAVSRDVADGELRLVRAEQLVKPGWADRFHDAMKKKKAEGKT